MPKPHSPRELTPQQLKRLRSYISVHPPLDHYDFLAKWDISRELTSEICRCHFRTINIWFFSRQREIFARTIIYQKVNETGSITFPSRKAYASN